MSGASEGGGPRTGRLQRRRVLLVEDEAIVAQLLEDKLRDAGAELLGPAATLAEAFRLAETALADGGLDAVILDVNLGGEQVLPLADWLDARGVPFIFATGYGNGPQRGRHLAAPVMAKPFDPDALVASLQAVMARG
ncbi:response regulator [Siccirubricoccus phaeus]|uniref:response regulator n=1 Tax=Siccirubricoccus phaeus TaxID=2595053 RepID=UPI0011F103E8|nr:response regulator [Siccirubricoccus phaeus]